MANPPGESSQPVPSAVRAVTWIAVGLALVALYYVLAALEVGKIGAPTDIGGGLIPLVGYYVLIMVGLVKGTRVLRARRSRT